METENIPKRQWNSKKHSSISFSLTVKRIRKPQQIWLQNITHQSSSIEIVNYQVVFLNIRYWIVLGLQSVHRHQRTHQRLSRGWHTQISCQLEESFLSIISQRSAEIYLGPLEQNQLKRRSSAFLPQLKNERTRTITRLKKLRIHHQQIQKIKVEIKWGRNPR